MRQVGLVLTGGGARAAYQVGALRAIAEILPRGRFPFPVITGISAGAINGVVLACAAADLSLGVEALRQTWSRLTPDRIFRTGALRMASIGSRWIRDLSGGGVLGGNSINYLLDSAPLRAMLTEKLAFARMRRHIKLGRLRGVAVSGTSYRTGEGITWFEGGPEIAPWARSNRSGLRARLTVDHVMASAAIPVFFPPVRVDDHFFGDGSLRLIYPMSPAIHMGAERILAISVRHRTPEPPAGDSAEGDHVPLSQIAGVILNAVFLDSLDTDLERLDRINRTLAHLPADRIDSRDLALRTIPVLVLRPTEDLGQLAADEYVRFPAMLRYLLKGIGVERGASTDLVSYLAFEPVYVSRLMALGYADTLARREEIADFLLEARSGSERRSSA